MKRVFGNLTSRAGEVVGHYKRTGLDENIITLENSTKATKNTADDLLKHLSPSGGLFSIASKGEAKVGDALVESGNKLKAADSESNFGTAVVAVGECWKSISDAQRNCNERVTEEFVAPLKGFVEGPLKESHNMKKKVDSARLEYDTTQRALQKKNDSQHEEEFKNAERKFQESKEHFLAKMEDIQNSEEERTEWLKRYVALQLAFHEKCVSLLKSLDSELDSTGGRKPVSRKRADSDEVSRPSGGATGYGSGAPSYGGPAYGSAAPPSYGTPAPPLPTYGAAPASSYSAPPPALPPQRPPRVKSEQQTCRALYDFEGASESELNFAAGQIITIVNTVDDDWYEGEVDGVIGIFPSNYVELL